MSVAVKNGILPELYHFINGQRVKGKSGRFGDITNPATGEVTARAPYASQSEINELVDIANTAAKLWAATAVPKRSSVIFNMRELMVKHKLDLAKAIGLEHGKTTADALGEIARAIDVVEFAAGIPHVMKGGYSPNVGGNIDVFSFREPLGVVAGISPFNFPVMVPLWMGAMAVACGNAYINKCSETDPSAALMVAELWQQAGLPNGVWNTIIGDKEAVDALLTHPAVPAISFVGSTLVGEYVYQTGAKHNKRVQAFTGAKNHMVIMPDANMEQAVDALIGAGYGSAGERCMAISVAVPVGEGTAKELISRLVPKVEELRIGPYDDDKTEINPLITEKAKIRVEGLIAQGVKEGAKLEVDGRGKKLQGYENGFWVGGTLFSGVKEGMEIHKTEIFGPVLSVMAPVGFDDAVNIINRHEYGNGTAIFTRDGDTAKSFMDKVDVGMIGVNVPIPVPVSFHHFGGAKRSKFGDTQMYGPESVVFFTKMKTISARWPSGIKEGAVFAMPSHK